MSCRALAAAVAAALLVAAPAAADEQGLEAVARSAEASRTTAYEGEALWVTFGADRPYVAMVSVTADGEGSVVVEAEDRLPGFGDNGAEERPEPWAMPLAGALERHEARLRVLEGNYEVEIEGRDHVMARPSMVLAFQRRSTDWVRERLWVDERSGLPLRRETYARSGELVRLGTFLSLDLHPDGDVAQPQAPHALEVMPLDGDELEAFRKAGWTVPEVLPGGYEVVAAFAVDADGSQPLQLVYDDGLYTVSVFQQAGSADWDTLPAGARPLSGVSGEAYEWPGALPHRVVWSVDGRTWTLVGDAPPDDLRAIAEALPMAEASGVVERLRRGFSRLWSAVSKWGKNLWS